LDRVNDRYILLTLGWDGNRRVYYPVIHIDIRDSKLWIQHDATEDGVATDLIAAGVPKDRIVLAFYPLEAHRLSECAAT
jgi:NAD(P)H-flavin reductase